jgi:hypothetical protein
MKKIAKNGWRIKANTLLLPKTNQNIGKNILQ